MPSSRQFRVIGLCTILALLVVYYVSNASHNTYDSDFYKSTVAAIDRKKTTAEREQVLSDEKERIERVERLRKEHEIAIDTAQAAKPGSDGTAGEPDAVPKGLQPQRQKPIAEDSTTQQEKSVAGRKKVTTKPDDGKIVQDRPKEDTDDGVAKVGNVGPGKPASLEKITVENEEEVRVDVELDDILKKGPIIVFSKTHCPYSKKAKHILLDLYTISPKPYVVELDTHPLGPGLQQHLHKSTGRRTVPNVLINGRSIGGGDDITALHESGKLISTITNMAGKRVTSIVKNK